MPLVVVATCSIRLNVNLDMPQLECILGTVDPCLERTFKGHTNYVTSLAFSPALRQIASGSGDNSILLWNLKPQLRSYRFTGHQDIVTDVQFSPNGDTLASASKDKTIRLWITQGRGQSTTFRGHTRGVRSIRFSSDSSLLISASNDKSIKIWNLPSQSYACTLVGHNDAVRAAEINTASHQAISGGHDTVLKLWDLSTKRCVRSYEGHDDTVNQVHFFRDDHCAVSCSADRSVVMWDLRSARVAMKIPGAHSQAVSDLSIHPNNNYMLTSSLDSSVCVWDVRQQAQRLYTLHGHTGQVHCSRFSQEGSFFATGGSDGLVMAWRSNLIGLVSSSSSSTRLRSLWTEERRARAKGRGIAPRPTAPVVPAIPSVKREHTCPQELPYPPLLASRYSHDAYGAVLSCLPPPPPLFPAAAALRPSSAHEANTNISKEDHPTAITSTRELFGSGQAGPSYRTSVLPRHYTRPDSNGENLSENNLLSCIDSSKSDHLGLGSQPKSDGPPPAPLPPSLAAPLGHILQQLEIITRAVGVLENRIHLTENKISSLLHPDVGNI